MTSPFRPDTDEKGLFLSYRKLRILYDKNAPLWIALRWIGRVPLCDPPQAESFACETLYFK